LLLQAFSASLQANASAVGGNGNNSSPGLLRLFTQPIDGQIAWLLPLALFSLLILVWQRPWRGPLEQGQQALILWGTWLLTTCVALSIAVHFLTYYTVMLAPAINALAGIGLTTLWRDYRNRAQKDWRGWILPFVPFFTGVVQTSFLVPYPLWSAWLSPLILFPAALVGLILLLVRILAFKHHLLPRGARLLAMCGALIIVIAPFIWSAVSLTYPASGGGPTAGPRESDLQTTLKDLEFSRPFSERTLNANEQMLLSYLSTHRGKTQFLVGTASASAATPLILVSGQPVMALGGFSGSDPGLTTSQLARDVGNNTIRFFWLTFSVQVSNNVSQQAERFTPTGGNRALVHWITTNCTTVPDRDWEPGRTVSVTGKISEFVPSGNLQRTSNGLTTNLLYDCDIGDH
jgi:4-amino-4-deoxy-L-arabinose transferase-like glycosyltransferase